MNCRNIIDENFDELAKGIVLLAVRDYQRYFLKLLKDKGNIYAKERLDALKIFFDSDWYHLLCSIDSNIILQEVESQCIEMHKTKKYKKLTPFL